jgi:hypothetical protein
LWPAEAVAEVVLLMPVVPVVLLAARPLRALAQSLSLLAMAVPGALDVLFLEAEPRVRVGRVFPLI